MRAVKALFFICFQKTVRKKIAFSSLPLEGKTPSAHTGRMRWKACVFDGNHCFFPVFICHLIRRLRRQLPLKGKPMAGRIHWCSI